MNEELKIGHCYNSRGIIYEVREEDKNNQACKDCAFYIAEEGYCTDIFPERMGPCNPFLRSDGKQVIFVEIGEGEPDPQDRVVEIKEKNESESTLFF